MPANGHFDQAFSRCPPLDNLISSSRTPSSRHYLKWVRSKTLKLEAFPFNTHHTISKDLYQYQDKTSVILLLIGDGTTCTQKSIDEFSRIHSLPTAQYSQPFNSDNFRRYSILLVRRNRLIKGFTELDNNFYM